MHESTVIINVHPSITDSMSASPTTTYTCLIPKRHGIAGDPDQVVKFDIFLVCLIVSIIGNTMWQLGPSI